MASFARGRWQVGGMTAGVLATDRTLRGQPRLQPRAGARPRVVPDHGPPPARATAGLVDHGAPGCAGQPRARARRRRATRRCSTGGSAAPQWDEYLNFEDVGREFRADNGFFGQNGYRRIYSETTRKFVGLWGFNDVSPYLFAEYKTDREGDVQYQQNNLGLRFGLPRATTLAFEFRPNSQTAVRPGGGLRKRDQLYFSIDSNPGAVVFEAVLGDRLRRSPRRPEQPHRQGRLRERHREPAPAPALRARVPHRQRLHRLEGGGRGLEAHHHAARAAGRGVLALHGARQRAHDLAELVHPPRAVAVGAAGVQRARNRIRSPSSTGTVAGSTSPCTWEPPSAAPRMSTPASGVTNRKCSPRDRGPSTSSSGLYLPARGRVRRRAPVSLEIVPAPPPLERRYANFWEAALALDYERAASLATSGTQSDYARALRELADGRLAAAQERLSALTADFEAAPRARAAAGRRGEGKRHDSREGLREPRGPLVRRGAARGAPRGALEFPREARVRRLRSRRLAHAARPGRR